MKILIKQALLQSDRCDLLIENNRISKISDNIEQCADTIINASNKAVIPAFYNMHTHAGMSILKGYSDDKELFEWLSKDIWPLEDKFNKHIMYAATKLAALEMIKTGTLGFCDMYFNDMQDVIMQAIAETGVRAMVSVVGMDMFDDNMLSEKMHHIHNYNLLSNPCPERIIKGLSVHSVYTASKKMMRHVAEKAQEWDMPITVHACETHKEYDDCVNKYGQSPIEVLQETGLLTKRTILAHAVYLNDKDIDIVLDKGCTLCTNPSSNLKLCSGIFDYDRLRNKGCNIVLGTDGSASNNSLNMITEMKIFALLAKIRSGDPTVGTAEDIFQIATYNGAKALGFDAGEIAEGKLADLLLVNLDNPLLVPNYNLISNMVYSADSSVIDTVICNGRILMQSGKVHNEKEIITNAREASKELLNS